MNEGIRIGVIGVGQIGKLHLETYRRIEGARIVAIADLNEAEARRVSELHSIPHVYTDFRELLKRDDIQAVDVCLHNNLHMPVTVAALQAGKHVYCEKPMAGSYRDAETMYHTAQQTGRKLAIQLSTLFRPETKAAKALIDDGMLGKIYHARSTDFRQRARPYVDGYGSKLFVQKRYCGGGALIDMGVYYIGRMLYLLGNPEVLRVSGKVYQEMDIDPVRKDASGYDVEEFGLGLVRFAGGVTMDIAEAWAIQQAGQEGSSVVGSKGGVRLEPFGFFQSVGHLDLSSTADIERFQFRLHNVREDGDVYDSSQHHWIAALQGRVELLPTAEVALNTMLISEAIYASDKLDREVTADEVRDASVSTAVKL